MFRSWALCALLSLCVAATALSAACNDGDAPASDDAPSLTVIASTELIAEWVRRVGGEQVGVRALVPPGADAHTLELSTGDIRDMSEADIVIINGAGLEAGYHGVILENADLLLILAEELEAQGLELHAFEGMAADAHEQQEADGDEHGLGSEDPHFWFDADLAIASVEAISAALAELAPDAADAFTGRAQDYIAEIRAADADVRELLDGLPADRRYLITFHDAFGYFARRYGLSIAGFVVEGPEQGVSAEAIKDLVALIKREGISRVFREAQFASSAIDAVANETGVEVAVIWSQPQGEVDTYLKLLRANAAAIAAE